MAAKYFLEATSSAAPSSYSTTESLDLSRTASYLSAEEYMEAAATAASLSAENYLTAAKYLELVKSTATELIEAPE